MTETVRARPPPPSVQALMRNEKARRVGRRTEIRRRLRPERRETTRPPRVTTTRTTRRPRTRGKAIGTRPPHRRATAAQTTRRSSGPSLRTSSSGAQLTRARRASTTAVAMFVARTTRRSRTGVRGAGPQRCSRCT